MAVYKVPQDVEADDKLIGPFSFRQFIYLLIVAGACAIGWFLGSLFLLLAVIPLPIIIFFGALALPLRKDQPMETYLAAIVAFYLKPRRRLWTPDGAQTLVQITAPKVIEVQRAKNLSEQEAEQRLSYLASIVDSRGWAVRGVQASTPTSPGVMTTDAYFEAQSAPDILDDSTGVGQAFDTRLDAADAKRHQDMLDRMQRQVELPGNKAPARAPATDPPHINDPYAALTPATDDADDVHPTYNPYPTMHQSMLKPIDPNAPAPQPAAQSHPLHKQKKEPRHDQHYTAAKKAGVTHLSPDIINLANNPDLSVETIAREANRIHEKEKLSDDEVVISLR